jgi:hypothetical protein
MASLFVILARNGRHAVIFRRGPSKQVLLIKWDRRSDRFEIGQWFKGRIFERRCDLSPSGEMLVYLAAKHKGPIPTWSAISRPPYLTALALWPNMGTWGGGGLFDSEYALRLNHDSLHRKLADGFQLPKQMRVHPLGSGAGGGEDAPIYHERLVRDGWTLTQKEKHSDYNGNARIKWRFIEPQVYEKSVSRHRATCRLQMILRGIGERSGPWYLLDYEVLGEDGQCRLKLPRTDWADWDVNGDLLFSQRGKLFRLAWSKARLGNREAAQELADFSDLSFAAKETPKRAKQWR